MNWCQETQMAFSLYLSLPVCIYCMLVLYIRGGSFTSLKEGLTRIVRDGPSPPPPSPVVGAPLVRRLYLSLRRLLLRPRGLFQVLPVPRRDRLPHVLRHRAAMEPAVQLVRLAVQRGLQFRWRWNYDAPASPSPTATSATSTPASTSTRWRRRH